MSDKKYVLLKVSDGTRGEMGKQKVYEIAVSGERVTFTWGMAEKASRQSKVQRFGSEQSALYHAQNQLRAKIAGGYRLAYAV